MLLSQQQINKDPATKKIEIKHFLHGYNPKIAPHMLAGMATLKSYDQETALKEQQAAAAASFVQPLSKSATMTAAIAAQRKKNSNNDDMSTTSKASTLPLRAQSSDPSKNPAEMRSIWQAVLRECHRADPERSGQVSRNVFISATERANARKVDLLLSTTTDTCLDKLDSCVVTI